MAELPPVADDTWELYDTSTDWSQAHDLAAEMPEKLEELKALFLEEARKYNVLPLDDRRIERFNSDLAGRPVLITGDSQLLFAGMGRLSENSVINVKNKSHSVTAQVTVPEGGAEGVIVAQGGAFAGWSLYLKDGKPKYCDVGSDTASPVSDDYTSEGSRFSGAVDWVEIDIAEAAEDLDHLISPEERLKIAMTRQ
jgi:hypothetical protein